MKFISTTNKQQKKAKQQKQKQQKKNKIKTKTKKAELLTQNCRKMSGTKDYNRLPYMDKN